MTATSSREMLHGILCENGLLHTHYKNFSKLSIPQQKNQNYSFKIILCVVSLKTALQLGLHIKHLEVSSEKE